MRPALASAVRASQVAGCRSALRLAASGDQLLGLDEELDLANAAAPELEIVRRIAGDGDAAVPAVRGDLALDRMDVRDCRVVEVLAPHERRHASEKRRARGGIAGHRPRLDQRCALRMPPRPSSARRSRNSPRPPRSTAPAASLPHPASAQRRRSRIRPQPEIAPEYVALGRSLLKDAHQVAREFREKILLGVGSRICSGPRSHRNT